MKKLSFGDTTSSIMNGAFVALFTRDNIVRGSVVPVVLFLQRYDGTKGFIGGIVEPGESLVETVIREAQEEVNLTIIEQELIPVCSYIFENSAGKPFTSHQYAMEVSKEKFIEVVGKIHKSEHFMYEVCGYDAALIYEKRKAGLPSLLQSSFAPSVKEGFIDLIIKFELFDLKRLKEIEKQAFNKGFND